jgi:hypothetical protein
MNLAFHCIHTSTLAPKLMHESMQAGCQPSNPMKSFVNPRSFTGLQIVVRIGSGDEDMILLAAFHQGGAFRPVCLNQYGRLDRVRYSNYVKCLDHMNVSTA